MAAARRSSVTALTVAAVLLLAGCSEPDSDPGRVPVSGFSPMAPPLMAEPFFRSPVALEKPRGLATPTVDSRQPTLSWEPAPGTHLAYLPFQPPPPVPFLRLPAERLAGVTYDLRIWPFLPVGAVPVYRRDAIYGTSHRVEAPLAADTVHCWSIRARFRREDGRPAVSEWSLAMWPSGNGREAARRFGYVPPAFCYRFRTPPA
jgi:hypothetical protein